MPWAAKLPVSPFFLNIGFNGTCSIFVYVFVTAWHRRSWSVHGKLTETEDETIIYCMVESFIPDLRLYGAGRGGEFLFRVCHDSLSGEKN